MHPRILDFCGATATAADDNDDDDDYGDNDGQWW